ncbi:MAG: Gfo/Idh/MocA family oxidoreductase [Clostridiales bacterium]|nr:Gfo/Idh/MocA family oxidoreductase [Clostridiales bacterium]
MEKIRVGLIGVGGIMNGVHIPAYQACNDCEITAICDINPATLKRVGEKLGIPEENRFLCYEKLMDSGLVDIVDIATPDAVHCKIAQAAVDRNIPISVEKPMGMSYKEVKAVCDAANAKNLPGHVCFSWHYRPYVRLMREQIVSGKLGKLYHVYIRCIKDSGLWEGRRLEWRFDAKHSASGVMGDLCSHMFDIARFIGNEFISVTADAGIFVKERQALDSDEILPVTTWDWCNVLAKMENDVNATFQISRTTKFIGDWIQVEAYGEKGRLIYSYLVGDQKLELQTEKGEIKTLIPGPEYNANQSQAYLNIVKNENVDGLEATLANACKCQAALDAAYRSVEEGRWVTIEEVEKEC